MLGDKMVWATIPVSDIEEAAKFYREKLGLNVNEPTMGQAMAMAGGNTGISLYERGPVQREATVATFSVDNLEDEVSDLAAKGVEFEEYDITNAEVEVHTVNGIASFEGGVKMAWFKDPDGNIIGLLEMEK